VRVRLTEDVTTDSPLERDPTDEEVYAALDAYKLFADETELAAGRVAKASSTDEGPKWFKAPADEQTTYKLFGAAKEPKNQALVQRMTKEVERIRKARGALENAYNVGSGVKDAYNALLGFAVKGSDKADHVVTNLVELTTYIAESLGYYWKG
jgi:hypothetical protein